MDNYLKHSTWITMALMISMTTPPGAAWMMVINLVPLVEYNGATIPFTTRRH